MSWRLRLFGANWFEVAACRAWYITEDGRCDWHGAMAAQLLLGRVSPPFDPERDRQRERVADEGEREFCEQAADKDSRTGALAVDPVQINEL
jgi:hypothetical protein